MNTPLDRRTLFKTAAAVVLAAGRATPLRGAGGMFVSLNGSLTRAMPWPDFARLAAKLGYGGVDVNLGAARERLRPERGAKPPSESERGWGPASAK